MRTTLTVVVLLAATSFALCLPEVHGQTGPSQASKDSSSQTDDQLGRNGPAPAEAVFKSMDIFKGKNATQVLPAMQAISGSLGVGCTYCHTQYEWDKNDKPPKETTRKMFRMIGFINKQYFPGENKVSCWTCHHAHPKQVDYPQDAPHRAEEILLIADADKDKPAEQVFHNIQSLKGIPAGRMPLIMNFFANSLGVQCSHCHVLNQWEKDDKDTKKRAREMLKMVSGIIKEFYGGKGNIGCWGCHEGKIKPELEPGKPPQPAP